MIRWNSSSICRKAFPKSISQVTKKSNFRSTISRKIRFTYGPKMMIRGFLYILYRWVKLSIIFCMWQLGKKYLVCKSKRSFNGWRDVLQLKTPSNKLTPFFIFRNERLWTFNLNTLGIVIQYNKNQKPEKKRLHKDIVDLYAAYTIYIRAIIENRNMSWNILQMMVCYRTVVLKYQIISWKCFVSTM